MQNQNQMLFPSHNTVVVVPSSAARVCGHSQLCDSSRHLLLRLLQRHPGAKRTYTRSLAGEFGWQEQQQQRSEATNRICGFGEPPQTEATKLAPTLTTAAAHHAVVNKLFFSFLAPPFFFGCVNLIIYLCVLGRINVILGRYFLCVCVCVFFFLQWIINAIKERHF